MGCNANDGKINSRKAIAPVAQTKTIVEKDTAYIPSPDDTVIAFEDGENPGLYPGLAVYNVGPSDQYSEKKLSVNVKHDTDEFGRELFPGDTFSAGDHTWRIIELRIENKRGGIKLLKVK